MDNVTKVIAITMTLFLSFLLASIWFSSFYFAAKLFCTSIIVLGAGITITKAIEDDKRRDR